MLETAVWCLAGLLELLFILFMCQQCFPNAREHITDYKNGFMYMLKDWWYVYRFCEFSYFVKYWDEQVSKDAIAAGLTPASRVRYATDENPEYGDMMCLQWSGDEWVFYKAACKMNWFERLRSKK